MKIKFQADDVVNKLPPEIQETVEHSIKRVIYESFIVPADEDYLTARLLAINGLSRAFFWSAAQAVEKYLKAYLISHGECVIPPKKGNKHSLIDLYDRAAAQDPSFQTFIIKPSEELSKFPSLTEGAKVGSPRDYVQVLDKEGNANNRYNRSGVEYYSLYLYALDNFVGFARGKLETNPIEDNIYKIGEKLMSIFYFENSGFKNEDYTYLSGIQNSNEGSIWSVDTTWLDAIKNNQKSGPLLHAFKWLQQRMWT